MRTTKDGVIFLFAILFTIRPSTALSEDMEAAPLFPTEEEQAFAIIDTLLPPKEKIEMKDAPPNGEVHNSDGSHYVFTPEIYVPRFGEADFPKEFISRLAKNHSRVMTQTQLYTLQKDGQFFYVFEGRSYLPTFFIIRRIATKELSVAEAVVYSGGVGGATERRILLEQLSGKWTIKKNKVFAYFD